MSGLLFDLDRHEPVQTHRAVWVMACPDGDAARLGRLLASRRHIMVDSGTGAAAVSPDDYLLLRDSAGETFQLLCPGGGTEAAIAPPELLTRLDARATRRGQRLQALMCLAVGRGRPGRSEPARNATPLERAITTLRHESFDGAYAARLVCSSAGREDLGGDASPLLLGLLDREAADAAQAIWRHALDPDVSPSTAHALYTRAGNLLEIAGLLTHATHTRALRSSFSAAEQPALPLEPSPGRGNGERPWVDQRLGYRALRVIGHRFELRETQAAAPPQLAGPRPRVAGLQIPDGQLCRWLTGLDSPQLTAWHEWGAPGADGVRTLTVGLDTDIAVLLGVAGRVGRKVSSYSLRAWGRGCDVQPGGIVRRVGEAVSLQVRSRSKGGAYSVAVELVPASGGSIPLRIEAPAAGGRPGIEVQSYVAPPDA